ncbi:SOR/SNZ family protein, partial [Brevibacterium sp. Mu109]
MPVPLGTRATEAKRRHSNDRDTDPAQHRTRPDAQGRRYHGRRQRGAGQHGEAQILESLGVDYIDESEVLSPTDYVNHIDKSVFTVPFSCGATNLGEALRRIQEGASMIRSKGEAVTGEVSEAMRHLRTI